MEAPVRYLSRTENRTCYIYKQTVPCECSMCGKYGTNLTAVVWEDDEQCLEYVYGSECIKKLKLKKIK